MSKIITKSKSCILVLSVIISIIFAPKIYSAVCQYVVSGSFVGELSHCYSSTLSSGVLSYTREFCVYKGTTTPEGISYSGTMTIDKARTERC